MTPQEVFLRLVHGVAAGRGEALADLYAEQTHVVHPFDPERGPALTTRDQLRDHFRGGTAITEPRLRFQPTEIVVHETADPEVIVAEFAYAGTVVSTGEPFRTPCIFVMRVRDGQIVESRDYLHHSDRDRALAAGGDEALHDPR